MAFHTVLKVVYGDNIPGDMVSSSCSRCGACIVRSKAEDMLNPTKSDLKVVAHINVDDDDDINLAWIHLCCDCQNEFKAIFDTFMKQRGKAKHSPAKSPNKRHGGSKGQRKVNGGRVAPSRPKAAKRGLRHA